MWAARMCGSGRVWRCCMCARKESEAALWISMAPDSSELEPRPGTGFFSNFTPRSSHNRATNKMVFVTHGMGLVCASHLVFLICLLWRRDGVQQLHDFARASHCSANPSSAPLQPFTDAGFVRLRAPLSICSDLTSRRPKTGLICPIRAARQKQASRLISEPARCTTP